MSKNTLTIAYDGEALQSGTMDVRELAPALLAFGNLLEEANKELNGNDSKMQVLVKSDFKAGSFHVDFEIIRSLGTQLSLLWNNVSTQSIDAILEHLGLISSITGISLLELFRSIRGRRIKQGTTIEQNNVRIEFEDNSEPIVVHKNVYQLFINLNIQEDIQKVLRPLEKEGIDRFFTLKDGAVQKEIPKSEINYYRTPEISAKPIEEKLYENTINAAYKIVTASFEEGYKWRLTNGQDKTTATLKDPAFINKIDNNEVAISKDDMLIVEMKTTQWNIQGNIKTENEIIRVLEHQKAYRQLSIPLYKDEE
ncbi:MAG: hypothetical protein AB7E31_10565 [Desulfitobacterium sp.]